MSYIPHTQWVGNSQPMQEDFIAPIVIKRLRPMQRGPVTKLLSATPWLTAEEIANALQQNPIEEDQVKSAERTMRRLHQHGVVIRAKSGAGKFIFGVRT